jgi:hypothetical protein
MKSLGVVKDDFVINFVFCIPCATNFMDFQLGLEMVKKKYSDLKLHVSNVASRFWGPCSVAHITLDLADRRVAGGDPLVHGGHLLHLGLAQVRAEPGAARARVPRVVRRTRTRSSGRSWCRSARRRVISVCKPPRAGRRA